MTDSILVAAAPAAVYAVVSDPTRTPEFSPENRGARTGSTGSLPVGAVFTGDNERRGFRWITECVVTAADPGARFAFRVRAIGGARRRLRTGIASWEHRLEPVTLPDGTAGTRVTQTWTDERRMPDPVATVFDAVATRGPFADFQRRNLATSLHRLKTLLEGPAAAEPTA
ncbi:SRPBCC family protein [Klenkia soli]|uniref:SRPBCC family protein n=1 Tax=Klenkia soli TaxID=1052260 RepID=UPI001F602865|nr:SRPBCC family protein [Klenkia soli]